MAEEKKVKVRYNTGYETSLKESIAKIYKERGRLKILGSASEEVAPEKEEVPEPKKKKDKE